MSWALVGDVADIVRIETLGSTALVGECSVLTTTRVEEAVDLGVRHQIREFSETTF